MRLAPNLAMAHAQLAVALASAGAHRWRESRREADRAVELAPNDSTVHFMAGIAALRRHQRRRAERHNLRVLELEPNNPMALTNLSVARLRRGQISTAADGFASATGLEPTNDLHRRNIEAAVIRFRARGVWIAIVIAVLSLIDHRFAAGIVIVPLAAAAGVVAARRTLAPPTWAYARQVPFRNPRAVYATVVVIGISTALAGVPFAASSTADTLVRLALFSSLGLPIRRAFRLLSGM